VSAAAGGRVASIQKRLANHARAHGMDPNVVLTRFAVERFLYRLTRSPHADRFVLKGALLMLVWLGEALRPTRDADLLGLGELSEDSLAEILREVCKTEVENDGLEYLPGSVRITPIRAEDAYGGLRAELQARMGKARIRVQIDVGIGDALTPAPEWLDYPTLLDFPRPRMRAYRPETAIAEKVHAMVVLGEANSRMRDFFDVYALAERGTFDGDVLAQAIRATFERRRTPIPDSPPLALTPAFGALPAKRTQWQAFLRRSGISSAPRDLAEIVERIAAFLGPVLRAAREPALLRLEWRPQNGWKPKP